MSMHEKKEEKEDCEEKKEGKGGPGGIVSALQDKPGVKKGVNLLGIVKKLSARKAKNKKG